METLKLQFPLITLLAPETVQEGDAKFDDFVPSRRMGKSTSLGNKPKWVKELPKTGTVWSPITLEKTLLLFENQALAEYIANEEKLPFVYGNLDFVSLSSPEEVADLITKSKAEKVKFFTVAGAGFASSEVDAASLKFEREEEES